MDKVKEIVSQMIDDVFYEQLHSELEQLILKFCDDEMKTGEASYEV